jgi:hypothetical protein
MLRAKRELLCCHEPRGCRESIRSNKSMPTYLDTHKHIEGLTAEAVAGAHARDMEVGPKYGVTYVRYWFDEATGRVYCLVEAPSAELAEQVHREAHGLLADEIIPVQEGV